MRHPGRCCASRKSQPDPLAADSAKEPQRPHIPRGAQHTDTHRPRGGSRPPTTRSEADRPRFEVAHVVKRGCAHHAQDYARAAQVRPFRGWASDRGLRPAGRKEGHNAVVVSESRADSSHGCDACSRSRRTEDGPPFRESGNHKGGARSAPPHQLGQTSSGNESVAGVSREVERIYPGPPKGLKDS